MFLRHVADAEDAGLRGFDEKHGLLADLAGHRHRQRDFEGFVVQRLNTGLQLDADFRKVFLPRKISGAFGTSRGKILHVKFFDGKGRCRFLLGMMMMCSL